MIHISFRNLLFSREYLHCICFLATDLAYALVSNQWAVCFSQMYFLKIVLPSKSKRFIRVIYICKSFFLFCGCIPTKKLQKDHLQLHLQLHLHWPLRMSILNDLFVCDNVKMLVTSRMFNIEDIITKHSWWDPHN